MKKNRKILEALNRNFEIDEIQDGSLSSITGGCGPMTTNYNCETVAFSLAEGLARAESICPAKTIFTGLKHDF